VRARTVVALLVAALVVYGVLLGQRAWLLVTSGRPVAVGLGVGVAILPVLGVVLVVRELRLGMASERLGRELAAEGGLDRDDLPRTPSGRIERAAADARFETARAAVEAAPQDWRAWYRLAVAYGDAGDARRGRAALRHAVGLHEADRRPAGGAGRP
jgi:hypothetical protein